MKKKEIDGEMVVVRRIVGMHRENGGEGAMPIVFQLFSLSKESTADSRTVQPVQPTLEREKKKEIDASVFPSERKKGKTITLLKRWWL